MVLCVGKTLSVLSWYLKLHDKYTRMYYAILSAFMYVHNFPQQIFVVFVCFAFKFTHCGLPGTLLHTVLSQVRQTHQNSSSFLLPPVFLLSVYWLYSHPKLYREVRLILVLSSYLLPQVQIISLIHICRNFALSILVVIRKRYYVCHWA